MIGWTLVIIYIACVTGVLLYAFLQFSLGVKYLKYKNRGATPCEGLPEELPIITIQLPLYNEKYVVERLLKSVLKIDYPNDKLEIQILDDSNDETTEIVERLLPELNASGIDFKLIRRENRIGFKAGALNFGLNMAKGDFIAIFDADFVINPEFLKRTICHFGQSDVGCVQTRWEHINRGQNILTKLQAFGLDGHFSVEQVGRNKSNHFINFNGTAGIWRKETIIDAGGWQHDTLTEDLDLSYRAQIKKWRFVYLEDVAAPSELPVAITAVKSQQFRWTKGGAENFVKNFKRLIFTKNLRFADRLNGLGHLFNSSIYFFIFISSIISVPLVYYLGEYEEIRRFMAFTFIYYLSTLFLMFYYWISFREEYSSTWSKLIHFVTRFFQFVSVSLGLSYHNTTAVLQAYSGKKTAFVRTPKFNNYGKERSWSNNAYLLKKLKFSTYIEAFFILYFGFGIFLSYHYNMFGMMVFHFLLMAGFLTVFIHALREAGMK